MMNGNIYMTELEFVTTGNMNSEVEANHIFFSLIEKITVITARLEA